jgi:hypothetical protein
LAWIEARRQIGQLMHHHVWSRYRDCTGERRGVEDIHHDGLDARGAQRIHLRCRAGRASDLMTGLDQKRRYAPANRARRARQENLHSHSLESGVPPSVFRGAER